MNPNRPIQFTGKVIPFMACADLMATLEWYKSVLGFKVDWTWEDPPICAGLARDKTMLYFTTNAELAGRAKGQEVFIFVDNADALHAQHVAAHVPIASPIADKPWGIREYTLRDPNGYELRITEAFR